MSGEQVQIKIEHVNQTIVSEMMTMKMKMMMKIITIIIEETIITGAEITIKLLLRVFAIIVITTTIIITMMTEIAIELERKISNNEMNLIAIIETEIEKEERITAKQGVDRVISMMTMTSSIWIEVTIMIEVEIIVAEQIRRIIIILRIVVIQRNGME
jgi:hypothetical protein